MPEAARQVHGATGTHLLASLAFLDNRTLNLDTDVPGGGWWGGEWRGALTCVPRPGFRPPDVPGCQVRVRGVGPAEHGCRVGQLWVMLSKACDSQGFLTGRKLLLA